MAFSLTGRTATVGTTEYWVESGSTTKVDQTTDCITQLWVDFAAMLAGDRYKVRLVEQINAGTQSTAFEAIVDGAQANPWVSPSFIVGEGWEWGVIKLAGTDRSILMSSRKVT